MVDHTMTGNGGTVAKPPAGPLAQAVRGGANVGAADRPPLPQAAKATPAVEAPKGVKKIPSEAVKAQLKILLSSPNPDARLKALKVASGVATPDMASDIALAYVFENTLKEKTFELLENSGAFVTQWQQLSNHSDSDKARIRAEVFGATVDQIGSSIQPILFALFKSDPVATVDSLAAIYVLPLETFYPNGNRRSISTGSGQRITKSLIDNALIMTTTERHPHMLLLADKLIEANSFEDAAHLIAEIKLPVGSEQLAKIAEAAKSELSQNTQLGRAFLNACEAIGTPGCLPLLEAVLGNHLLHERIADVTAKILQIDVI